MKPLFLSGLLVSTMFVAHVSAQTSSPQADWQLLTKAQSAARRLSYSGVLVYHQGSAVQTSRITHVVDGNDSREKLEMLDGMRQEILRHNDDVRCLMPDQRTVVIEQDGKHNSFPTLLQTPPSEIARLYKISTTDSERVAGLRCDMLNLGALDKLRYSYRLCIEPDSGLMLKSQTFNERNELIEQIVFSDVQIGRPDRAHLAPSWSTKDWTTHDISAKPVANGNGAAKTAQPYRLRYVALPGYQQIKEVHRSVPGRADVTQFVLSDGLAAISIFIEPERPGHVIEDKLSSQGAINILRRRQGAYQLTVVGEAPVAAIQQLASSVEILKPQ